MGRPKKFDTEKIREEYISGFMSLRKIADNSEVSYSYISKLASKEKWSKLRRQRVRNKSEKIRAEAKLQTHDSQRKNSSNDHIERSLFAGEQIHKLLRETTQAVDVGDVRSLKTLVDAWAGWDDQMRKNHRLDEKSAISPPVVNIALLSTLPDKKIPANRS